MKLSIDQKQAELLKYRLLVLATIDYYLDNKLMQITTDDFNSEAHFTNLKKQAELYFQKGSLGRLKQWFRDLSEMQLETRDLKFNKYLLDKTGYDIDVFATFFQRIEKIVTKGKITSDNQFYDVRVLVDQLCQVQPPDERRIELFNKLLLEYEQRKSSGSPKAIE